MIEKFKLFTDGGSRGNPGPGGIGLILFDHNLALVDFQNKFIKNCTNNQAEYMALLEGLRLAKKNKVKNLECFLDSELVVKQINGEYKIKDENLRVIKLELDKEAESFDSISFTHVRREKNKFADRLVNLALDNVLNEG